MIRYRKGHTYLFGTFIIFRTLICTSNSTVLFVSVRGRVLRGGRIRSSTFLFVSLTTKEAEVKKHDLGRNHHKCDVWASTTDYQHIMSSSVTNKHTYSIVIGSAAHHNICIIIRNDLYHSMVQKVTILPSSSSANEVKQINKKSAMLLSSKKESNYSRAALYN